MATKQRNCKTFAAIINGESYFFHCYTTDTRNGFCHTCWCDQLNGLTSKSDTTKVSYYNRTWESFPYETVLYRAIRKFPQAMQEELTKQIILHERQAEEERCDKMFGRFKELHDGLTDKQKQLLADTMPELRTEQDAQFAMGIMGAMNLLNSMNNNH